MSFTFSHPAVVLPLLSLPKKWRSSTGLIIGSMAPDFEKFINMSEYDPHSHTWWGIFYFDLPLGLLLSFLFHQIVRDPLISNLPAFLRVRFQRFMDFDWIDYFKKNYLTFTLSLLVGIFSHLILDVLTHEPGHRGDLFPYAELGTGAVTSNINSRMSNAWLQIASSSIGLIVLVIFVLILPKEKEVTRTRSIGLYWLWVIVVTLAITGIRSQIGEGIKPDLFHPSIVLISAGLISLVVSPIIMRLSNQLK